MGVGLTAVSLFGRIVGTFACGLLGSRTASGTQCEVPDRIPELDANGNLPPGVYRVTLKDIESRFTWNAARRRLFRGLRRALANLASAGIRRIWIDGGFVTSKDDPDDIDGCWEQEPSMDPYKVDPVFFDTWPPRQAMRDKYGVDFMIAGTPLEDRDAHGATVEQYFQRDRDGNPKGILLVDIGAAG